MNNKIEQIKGLTLNLSELEELSGQRRQDISSNLEALGVPFNKGAHNSKVYNLVDIIKFSQLSPVGQKQGENPDNWEGDVDLKKRSLLAKTELDELKLSRLRNELVPISEVASTVASEYQTIRDILINLGTTLAPTLTNNNNPIDISNRINEAVNEALEVLSTDKKYNEHNPETTLADIEAEESNSV